MDLNTLVKDDIVRVGASVFPVMVSIESNGTGPCRLFLFQDPESPESWVVGVWTVDVATATVVPLIVERVEKIVEVNTRRMHFYTEDGRHVVSTPARGCACGQSRLRMFNPFGDSINLASVPVPRAGA